MGNNSYLDKLENLIDQLFYEGTINQGTLQILSDMFCSLYEVENKEIFLSQLKDTYQIEDTSLESLNQYLDRELKGWEQDNEDYEEIFKERFNIGESMKYPNVKEFLKDLDYEIMQGVLNGSITSGFKQTIPEELFGEFLPLDSFEENVLNNIKRFYKDNDYDPKECDELLSNPKELKSFDENIVDIIIYIYEKTSMDCIAEFAYHNGLTLKEIKERLYGFYKYLLDK
tara:strand:- start:967 stop:1650 length:684 start_codon:yes stop_codon:yes gene_type:complete